VAYDVRAERADPRPLAAIRAATAHQQLGADIIRLLDKVWPVLREQHRDDDPAKRRTDVYFLLEAPTR
jgi:hypothetical protein